MSYTRYLHRYFKIYLFTQKRELYHKYIHINRATIYLYLQTPEITFDKISRLFQVSRINMQENKKYFFIFFIHDN